DRADDAYGRALELGTNSHAALGRLRTAVRAREPAALAEAVARLEPLVVGDGVGAAARAVLIDERADLAHKAGDVDGALARSDEAIELDPQARLPWLARALLSASRATKTAEAAERRLRAAHALTPSDTTSLVALCALVGDPDALGARAKLAEGAAQVEWHVEHGEALEAAGRLGDAAQATTRAL